MQIRNEYILISKIMYTVLTFYVRLSLVTLLIVGRVSPQSYFCQIS